MTSIKDTSAILLKQTTHGQKLLYLQVKMDLWYKLVSITSFMLVDSRVEHLIQKLVYLNLIVVDFNKRVVELQIKITKENL